MSEKNGMQVDFFSEGIEIRNVFFVNRPVSIDQPYKPDSGNAEGDVPTYPLGITRKYIEFDQGDSSEFWLNQDTSPPPTPNTCATADRRRQSERPSLA